MKYTIVVGPPAGSTTACPTMLRVPLTVSASCVLVVVGFAATVVFTVRLDWVVVCALAAGAARTAHARAAPARDGRMRVRFIRFSREDESLVMSSPDYGVTPQLLATPTQAVGSMWALSGVMKL